MDNFIDRITNRFSGQDVIKANAEAEAQEMRKLKAQTENAHKALAQYDDCMQEMRKLNLKNAESAKAVAELIENAQVVLQTIKNIEIEQKEDGSEEIINRIYQILGDNFGEKITALDEKLVNNDEKVVALAEKLASTDIKITKVIEKLNATDSVIDELRAFMAKDNDFSNIKTDLESAVHKENVKVYRNVQAALLEETGKLSESFKEDIKGVKGFNKKVLTLVILALLVGLGNLSVVVLQLIGIL